MAVSALKMMQQCLVPLAVLLLLQSSQQAPQLQARTLSCSQLWVKLLLLLLLLPESSPQAPKLPASTLSSSQLLV
jgi:hypothetical protein